MKEVEGLDEEQVKLGDGCEESNGAKEEGEGRGLRKGEVEGSVDETEFGDLLSLRGSTEVIGIGDLGNNFLALDCSRRVAEESMARGMGLHRDVVDWVEGSDDEHGREIDVEGGSEIDKVGGREIEVEVGRGIEVGGREIEVEGRREIEVEGRREIDEVVGGREIDEVVRGNDEVVEGNDEIAEIGADE